MLFKFTLIAKKIEHASAPIESLNLFDVTSMFTQKAA